MENGLNGQDSMRVDLRDKMHTVVINSQDHYRLFPGPYAHFKEEASGNHSITALLNLLSDGLGDYPISATLALINYRLVIAKQIKQATINTQRSQADMIDTWPANVFTTDRKSSIRSLRDLTKK